MADTITEDGEEWRRIDLCPDYEVSSLGRIRRLTAATSTKPGKILKPAALPTGYLFVHLRVPSLGKRRQFYVNRLVARAFHGSPPSDDHQAAHWDRDKTNNRSRNVRWATPIENNADKKRHGTHLFGESCPSAKLNEGQVVTIRQMAASGVSLWRLANDHGVTWGAIKKIVTRGTWAHI